jgi:hypothetical protein
MACNTRRTVQADSRANLLIHLSKETIMPIKLTPKQSVHLVAGQKITLDQINKAVERAIGIGGCLSCGLLGIDLHFYGPDPIAEKFNTDGIAGVVIRNGPQGI